ncbi:MAG TPA: ATP synthase F1 subunit epsilon [Bacilli bacterium]|nr:ATP synthase F1 subunit epsilon [Bacilli bacterium]HPS18721.1 ATP synthase F1 subunit epsilon [Bacilli bacterium]
MASFFLDIYTPFGHYLKTNASFLEVQSEDYLLGILPEHAPLVSSLVISKMVIEINATRYIYAIGGGIISIDKDGVTLLLDSIERSDEINLQRALDAKMRAEQRLSDSSDKTIDKKRAELALARAINRIHLIQTDK